MKNEYYKNITVYKKWKATFKNINYICHGIIEKIYKWDDMSDITRDCKIDNKYYMDNIAFINVKKAPGSARAQGNLVRDSYNNHKELLLKQIDTINPDIIFNGSGIHNIMSDVLPNGTLNTDDFYFHFTFDNNRLFINTFTQCKLRKNMMCMLTRT